MFVAYLITGKMKIIKLIMSHFTFIGVVLFGVSIIILCLNAGINFKELETRKQIDKQLEIKYQLIKQRQEIFKMWLESQSGKEIILNNAKRDTIIILHRIYSDDSILR